MVVFETCSSIKQVASAGRPSTRLPLEYVRRRPRAYDPLDENTAARLAAVATVTRAPRYNATGALERIGIRSTIKTRTSRPSRMAGPFRRGTEYTEAFRPLSRRPVLYHTPRIFRQNKENGSLPWVQAPTLLFRPIPSYSKSYSG